MEENKEESKKENFFEKLLKKEVIISLVVGLLLGIIIMFFANGGFAVTVSGKVITTGNLYNKMKDYYSIDLVLEDVDSKILNKKYKLSEEDLKDIKETADNYIKQYEAYGYSQEQFLEENGFKDYDNFVDYLSTDYKRSVYFYDYLATKLEKNAVENYYNENSFGKVNTKHILVKTSDDMTEDKALALANEIINKLNSGENFDTLAKEYTTNYSEDVITEDLGEMGAFDNLEEGYVEEMKNLEAGKYSTEPVKTSYGYHVIYCVDRKEKTEEITLSERMSIIGKLAQEANLNTDNTEYYKALIQMRKDAHLKFYDKELKAKYEEYCNKYVEEDTQD